MGKYMWKFLNLKGKSIVSNHGGMNWKLGEWQHVGGSMKVCKNGLHASKTICHAFSYVQGEVLAVVEVKGKHHDEEDKSAYSDMRIVEAYKWTKKDSVALSIFTAEMCLKEFEKLYPDDDRPKKAIDAARAVLAHDTKKTRSAARSAESAAWSAAESAAGSAAGSAAWSAARSAARSAESAAGSAARSAARSAESAAGSAARSAARSAAWSAESAARSAARSAAWSAESAARSAVIKKIDKWFKDHIKEMEKI